MQRGISTSKNIFLGRRCYKSDVSTRIAGSGLTEFPLGDKTFRQVIAERQHKLTTAIELEREAQREQMVRNVAKKVPY